MTAVTQEIAQLFAEVAAEMTELGQQWRKDAWDAQVANGLADMVDLF